MGECPNKYVTEQALGGSLPDNNDLLCCFLPEIH